MSYLENLKINCPYCGEQIELQIDRSIEFQEYIEDCQVCCKPISLSVNVSEGEETAVIARQENE